MEFSTNSPFLYLVGACVIIFVLAQSVLFLVRAYRRGKELGISTAKLRKTIVSTSVFTIAPAISFLLGVVTLSKFLGIPLPWIRMSVIGAITYELPAATAAAGSFGITELSQMITDPKVYAAIAWVMTLGIIPSIILPPILMKKIRGGSQAAEQGSKVGRYVYGLAVFGYDLRLPRYGVCGYPLRSGGLDSRVRAAGFGGADGRVRSVDQKMRLEMAGDLRHDREYVGGHGVCRRDHPGDREIRRCRI